MKIAVCDDEKIFAQTIYDYLWHQLDCHVDIFLDPSELIEKYQAGERYDIIFCDILMEPLNGIEAGKIIRSFDTDVYLIYLTSSLEYAPMGYEVNAFRYLLKPVKKKWSKTFFLQFKKDSRKKILI